MPRGEGWRLSLRVSLAFTEPLPLAPGPRPVTGKTSPASLTAIPEAGVRKGDGPDTLDKSQLLFSPKQSPKTCWGRRGTRPDEPKLTREVRAAHSGSQE